MANKQPRRKHKKSTQVTTEQDATINLPAETEPAVGTNLAVLPAASFPIVGIGASAGGLAAFEAFFSGMPADTEPGMAFVLVQHLAPDHKSILTDLIRRYTRMQVFEVEDGMTVKPNCAYIIPPNRDMAFLNGTLQLLEPSSPRGHRLPIDFFFRSLALDQRERAICIVLSGTGSDGTLGVRAIKGEGGMVMAQNPESTEYDGMPRSAIATGLVDFELPPAEMPAQLAAYVAHAFGRAPLPVAAPLSKAENVLKKIFVLLRVQTGHDFSQYKPNTIHRRIERRMAVQQIDTLDAYLSFARQTPAEVDALFRDLLIGVTNFFRDPEAFKAIEEQVIPKLFAGTPADGGVRIWSAGCSTGEEAYSLAILLQEHLETLKRSCKVQIFATDIDSHAIATARIGLYPASIAADLSPERLTRFFTAEPDGSAYRIRKNIRDMVVFSEQDVIKDPPFSKLDLISCRNLLIYMSGDLQKRLVPLFHYALNPDGFLFLGTSETVGEFGDLFVSLNRKAKLYQRKEDSRTAQRAVLGRLLPATTPTAATTGQPAERPAFAGRLPLRELTEKALLQQIAPTGALVDGQGNILYLHGRSGMYLEPAQGEAGINNILKMAREGLRRELTVALHKAAGTKEIVRHAGLRVKTNGDFTTVDLTIRPVVTGSASKAEPPLYLVILEDVPPSDGERAPQPAGLHAAAETSAPDAMAADTRVEALKLELRAKEEYLQTANEELETANEELKSSNEEMQSVNEELQSTNEELETSKEELQSINEELATVNAELQTKVADLSRTNNDMNNLLVGTGIGTVFVDHRLRILRFTPAVTQIINLILGDVGRPVGHIVSNLLNYNRLSTDVKEVLDTLVQKQLEVQTTAGKWYTLRIQPYRTLDNVIEGAVITFFDVTEMKQMEEALRKRLKEMDCLYACANLIQKEGNLEKMFQGIADVLPNGWLYPEIACARVVLEGQPHQTENFRETDWRLSANVKVYGQPIGTVELCYAEERPVRDEGPFLREERQLIDSIAERLGEVAERAQAVESLRKANDLLRLAAVVRDSRDAITVQDVRGHILAWNPGATRMYGWSEAEALAMTVSDITPECRREEALAAVRQLSQAGILSPYRTERVTKDGRTVEVWLTASALINESGTMYAVATTERLIG